MINKSITALLLILFSSISQAWTGYSPDVAAQLKRQADEMALANDITLKEIKKSEEKEKAIRRALEIEENKELSKNFYCKTYGRGCDK